MTPVLMILKIPVEIVELDKHSYHLFVEVFVNGQRCDMIIDTGASKTVFALNHINPMLEVPASIQSGIQSAGINAGDLKSHQGVLRHFRIGDFFVAQFEIILIDLSSIDQIYSKLSSKSVWGLIGSDFLFKYKAKLDYGKRMLILHVPRSNIVQTPTAEI